MANIAKRKSTNSYSYSGRTFNVAYIVTKCHNDGLNLKRLTIIANIQTNGRTDEVKTGPDFY